MYVLNCWNFLKEPLGETKLKYVKFQVFLDTMYRVKLLNFPFASRKSL